MSRAIIGALLIAHSACAAAQPISVTFHELVEHPKQYNGKRVSLRAYLVTSCGHCGDFYADRYCAHHHREKHCVAIGRLVNASLMDAWPRSRIALPKFKMPNDGFVQVTGIFRWKDLTPSKPRRTSDPNIDVISMPLGFGWMNILDKTITDITEYRPIGGNIPAGIN